MNVLIEDDKIVYIRDRPRARENYTYLHCTHKGFKSVITFCLHSKLQQHFILYAKFSKESNKTWKETKNAKRSHMMVRSK